MSALSLSLTSVLRVFSRFADDRSATSLTKSRGVKLLTELYGANSAVHKWKSANIDALATHLLPKQLVNSFLTELPQLQTELLVQEFVLALEESGCSHSTVKNYRSDINQFAEFAQVSELGELLTKPKLVDFVEYQRQKGLKDSSITRKLKSIAQFGQWSHQHQLISEFKPWFNEISLEKILTQPTVTANQSSAAPTNSAKMVFSPVATKPTPSKSKIIKSLSYPKNQTKTDFTQAVSPTIITKQQLVAQPTTPPADSDTPIHIKTWIDKVNRDIVRTTRMRFLPYLNLALIILFFLGLSFFGYTQLRSTTLPTLAYPSSPVRPSRVLSFQGRLTDTAQNPIVSATDMRFYLYDAASGGTQLWDSGVCSIDPDQDGIFSAGLGDDCGSEITEDVFSENASLWLEVEVESETLDPRQPIRTVAFALNSETVQGFPIDASESATANTILVMNEWGEVILGETNPTLKAVSGTFTLEGESLMLQTTSGSNGDITLSPDGTGGVIITSNSIIQGGLDLQGYLAAPGATFSATYAGGIPLTVKGGPSGTVNIQEWQNSAGSALTVINQSGNLGIGDTSPTSALTVGNGDLFQVNSSGQIISIDGVAHTIDDISGDLTLTSNSTQVEIADHLLPATDSTYDLGSLSQAWANIYGDAIYQGGNQVCDSSGNCGSGGLWANTLNVFHPRDEYASIVDLAIGGTSTASADIQLLANGGAVFNQQGNNADFRIEGDTDANVFFVDASADNVGIGTSSPSSFKLQIGGNVGPDADSTYDLGSLSLAWANIYGDALYQGGNQVCDSSGNCGGSSIWTNTNNAYHPTGASAGVVDVLIGGNSTASANIVLHASGNASFSGHLAIGANSAIDNISLLYPGSTATNTLSIQEIATDLASVDFVQGLTNYLMLNPSGTVTADAYGFDSEIQTDETNSEDFNSIYAAYLDVSHGGSGNIANLYGTYASAQSGENGSATNVTGLYGYGSSYAGTAVTGVGAESAFFGTGTLPSLVGLESFIANTTTGTVTSGYGIRINSATNPSGTITNNYGLYIQNQTVGATDYALVTNAGNVVFNEGGDASTDFRIEGDTDANLFFVDASTDRVGIGTNTPGSKLSIVSTDTQTSGVIRGISQDFTVNPSGVSTATHIGLRAHTDYTSSNSTTGVRALFGTLDINGTGAIINGEGVLGGLNYGNGVVGSISDAIGVSSNSDIEDASATNANAFFATMSSVDTGSITTNYGLRIIEGTKGAGTITTQNGIFIAALTNGTNNFGIFGDGGDWLLDADGNGSGGGTTGGGDLFLGEDQDLNLYHNGTNSFIKNNTGKLILEGVATSEIVVNETGANVDFRIEGDTQANLIFADASADAVGIGVSAPVKRLEVKGLSGTTDGIKLHRSSSGQDTELTFANEVGAATWQIHFDGSSPEDLYIYPDASGKDLILQTNEAGSTLGNVGIGDLTPDAKLNIQATTEQLRLDYNDSNYASFIVASDGELTLATTGTDPDITLNPGTSGSLIFADLDCSSNANGGALTTNSSGVVSCSDDEGGGSSIWSLNGSDAYYNSGNVGIGTSTPTAKLHVDGAVTGKALAIFNETGDQSILVASSSGVPVFEVKHDGDLVIGNPTKEDVKVTVYGDIFQPDDIKQTAATDIQGSFLYDTTQDRDAGAWRKSLISRNLSWYTESKDDSFVHTCDISTDDRCGTSAFPAKAYITYTNKILYIYDMYTNTLWMKASLGSGNALGTQTNNDIQTVYAKNGSVFVGTAGSSSEVGMTEFNFKKDTVYNYDISGRTKSNQNIAGRNGGSNTFSDNSEAYALSNSSVNDIDGTYHDGDFYLAIATNAGINLLNTDYVLDYVYIEEGANTNAGDTITDDGDNGNDAINAFDNSQTSSVRSNAADSTLIVTYQFASAKVLKRYGLMGINTLTPEGPSVWTFEGSNNGSTWTVLDSQSGHDWVNLGSVTNQKFFKINNSTSYLYYRLNVTDVANAAADQVSISEIFLQTAKEKPASRLYSEDVIQNYTTSISSALNTSTFSPRHISDYRRSSSNGEFAYQTNIEKGWVDINLRNPEIHTQYMITNEDGGSFEPSNFALRGSNDGVNWTTLDVRTGQALAIYEVRTYTFTNTTAYKFYRLETDTSAGAATTVLGDFILGAPVITAFSSFNDTSFDEKNVYLQDTDTPDTNYMWTNVSGSISSQYIQYDYGAGKEKVITSYGVRGFQSTLSTRAIRDWRIQGSNNGSSWTTLDTQTSQSFADEYSLKTYTFSNATPYRYYRLQIDANNGDANFVGLRGLYFFGAEERVFASSDENGHLDNINRVHDAGDHGVWTSFSGDVTPWLEKHFAPDQAATVSAVSITGWGALTEAITDFRIQGSNDRSTWTTLLEINRRNLHDYLLVGTQKTYVLPNDTNYQFIRLQVDDVLSSTTNASLTELDFLGGVYTNVEFTGSGIAGTNATLSQVDIFDRIWDDEDSRPLDWDRTDAVATDAIISHDTIASQGNNLTYLMIPSLTGAITNTKRPFFADGTELYIGHDNGFDRMEINPTYTGYDSNNTFQTKVDINGSYSTTRNIANRFNLDHYWPMDEASEAAQITDYGLGNANSEAFGSTTNNTVPTSTPSGKVGRGYALNRTTNQAIIIPDESIGNFGNWVGNQGSTMGLWVYPNAQATGTVRYIMGDGVVTTEHFGFMLRLSAGNIINLFGADGSGGLVWDTNVLTEASVNPEEWSHIVVVLNQEAGASKYDVYVNGVLAETVAVPALHVDGGDYYFGDPFVSGNGFDGRIDEAFVAYRDLSPEEIKAIYLEGLANGIPTNASVASPYEVNATDADVFSSTTIGDTTLNIQKDAYVGRVVEIIGGTGVGQSRMIVSNTATTFTVAPAWNTTPTSSSDFTITPFALPGSVNKVSALRPDQKDVFIGLNDNANGGGVVRMSRKNQVVNDYYHGEAGKNDDHGGSWDTTSGYDNVIDIETTTDNLLIATAANYWRERIGDSIMEAIDKLQQGFSAALINTHTNDSGGSSRRNLTRQVIRKGWGFIDSDDTSHMEYYGITYDTPPIVLLSAAGTVAGTANNPPTSLSQCEFFTNSSSNTVEPSQIDREKFIVRELVTNGSCYTWLSIGDYSDSMPDGSFAGGADLAEWYGTDDETLQAGEIVAVAPSGDIKVVRSNQPQDSKAIGIIATQPSITLGPESGLTPGYNTDPQLKNGSKTAVQVALAGRVPVRVSLENGVIEPGDYLTTGSVPGVAVKAIHAGPTIGKAMERFDGRTTIVAIADSTATKDMSGLQAEMENSIASDSAEVNSKVQILDQNQADLDAGFGHIMAFVNTSYFDPSYTNQTNATTGDTGTYAIDSQGKLVGLGAYSFDLVDNAKYLSEVIDTAELNATSSSKIDAPENPHLSREDVLQAALGRLQSLGRLSLKELNTADLRVLGNLFVRKAEVEELKTDTITPFVSNDLNLQVGSASKSGKLNIKDYSGNIVANIDDQGNTSLLGSLTVGQSASVAGTLQAGLIETKSARFEELEGRLAKLESIKANTAEIVNATISGTLYANDIAGFQDKVAAALKEPSLLSKLLGTKNEATASASPAQAIQIANQAGYQPISSASGSAALNLELSDLALSIDDVTLQANAVFINDYFKVNGNSYVAGSLGIGQDVFIDHQLQIGTSTILADGSLSFTAHSVQDIFHIQPSGKGTLSLMAGLLTLDETGQAYITGDLTVAGNVRVKDTLLTNFVTPGDFTNPLQVQLATRSGQVAGTTSAQDVLESRFEIINELGTPVATISAQGKASFDAGINLGAENLTATDSAEVRTSKTAGVARVKAGTNVTIIWSPLITKDTLIYVTPVGPTGNQVLYVKGKLADDPETETQEGAFSVGFEHNVTQDIEFNWWIVN